MKPGRILKLKNKNKLEKDDLYNTDYYERGVRRVADNQLINWLERQDLYNIKKYFHKDGLILEVGCGDGKISRWLSSNGFRIEAIDISKEAIKIARKQHSKVNFIQGEVFDLKRGNGYYDAVFSLHVMEHIRNIDRTLKEIYRILKKNGKLIIRIPNSDSLEARLAGKSWFHWDEPYHKHHWTSGGFRKILIKNGFKEVTVNFKVLEYKQVLLYSCLNKVGVRTDNFKVRLRLLPFQMIFVPVSIILGFLFKNSGTIELVARKI